MKLLFKQFSETSSEYQRHDNGLVLLEELKDGQTLIDRLDYYESEIYENEDGIVVDHNGCEVYDKDYPRVADFDNYKYYVSDSDDLSTRESHCIKCYVDYVGNLVPRELHCVNWVIEDEFGNHCFTENSFKNYEDAWDFLYVKFPVIYHADGTQDDQEEELNSYFVIHQIN